MRDMPIITCPVCGQEYLPSEIFIPNDFFGKQREIHKDESGKIVFYLGEDMNLEEEYICDSCGAKLKVSTNLSFTVDSDDKTLEEEYISTFEKPKKLKLPEVNLFD